MHNIAESLSQNLEIYERFENSRASVSYPAKMDVPLVWEQYLDSTAPVNAAPQGDADYQMQALIYDPKEFSPPALAQGGAQPEIDSDPAETLDLLNGRLKSQARRYAHPLTNELGSLGY